MPWDQINRARYTSIQDLNGAVSFLNEKHTARIKSEPEFAYIYDDIARYNKEKDRTSISLVESDRIKERESDKKLVLSRANERLKRLGKAEIASIEDAPDILERFDPELEETVHITSDYIKYGRYAKH